MRIVTIGAGYVGLVSGCCLAELGHTVTCVDRAQVRIAQLKAGISPIYEPGLAAMMAANVAAGRLSFSDDMAFAVQGADAVFICVGTPQDDATGHADLSFVYAVAEQLAGCIAPGTVVVTKSTVPVGTNQRVAEILAAGRPGEEVLVASNPEFLREGSAIQDFMEPDRIVVGAETEIGADIMRQIYALLTGQGHILLMTDLASAEMIKYASNAFLATKVTFINEVARMCEKTGADVELVSEGMGLDQRIGNRFLKAGPGYGGSCFPKDTAALASMARDIGVRMNITEAVMLANTQRKMEMVDKIVALCGGDISGKTIAVFGVTFKPDTDDMRDAPSCAILPALYAAGAKIRIVDPEGEKEGRTLFPWAEWEATALAAAAGADAAVILTEWDMFREMDIAAIAAAMRAPRLADLRNIFDAGAAKYAGFEAYASVGRVGF